jgi:hypothetical protein
MSEFYHAPYFAQVQQTSKCRVKRVWSIAVTHGGANQQFLGCQTTEAVRESLVHFFDQFANRL